MGFAAWMVFLGGLALGIFSLFLLVRAAVLTYRTLRCAYRDSRTWTEWFAEQGEQLSQGLQAMKEKVGSISSTGREIQETVEDIRDALDETRNSPLLRAARFAARLRR